jgi:hypothetical protein
MLTVRTPFSFTVRLPSDCRFKQTSTVGGSSVTLQTAETVIPYLPAGPSVVTIVTAVPSWAIADRNSLEDNKFKSYLLNFSAELGVHQRWTVHIPEAQ